VIKCAALKGFYNCYAAARNDVDAGKQIDDALGCEREELLLVGLNGLPRPQLEMMSMPNSSWMPPNGYTAARRDVDVGRKKILQRR
jgi:hypothetical protein